MPARTNVSIAADNNFNISHLSKEVQELCLFFIAAAPLTQIKTVPNLSAEYLSMIVAVDFDVWNE